VTVVLKMVLLAQGTSSTEAETQFQSTGVTKLHRKVDYTLYSPTVGKKTGK
jgi:hypothetical protein